MGAWGTGLYSGDFALDMRSTIRAVARLPYHGDRLVELLCDSEPAAATRPDDPDHTVFWLVVADQFAKRSIDSPRAREMALSIIDQDRDLATFASLGMPPKDLERRRRVLDEVRARLLSPIEPGKPRPTLKQPQPYLFEIGDCYAYPTSDGNPINPYFASLDRTPSWRQDGWGVTVVVERGRAFDFLAWYRFVTVDAPFAEKPAAPPMEPTQRWLLRQPGTVTSLHIKRLRLDLLGSLRIDPERLWTVFPRLPPGTVQAANDISIVGDMEIGRHILPAKIAPPGEAHDRRWRAKLWSFLGLETILVQ